MSNSGGRTSDPTVLALRCGACSAELAAASNDVAFRCRQCGRSWEIEGGLRERPSAYIAPPAKPAHPLINLPYWRFSMTASAKPKRGFGEGGLSARDRAARFQHGYVSAYAIYRPTYIGEWGLNYTRLQPDWEAREGPGAEAPGAALSSRDAAEIVRHYVLAEIDLSADLGLLNYSVEVHDPLLLAVPAYDLGTALRCPWTGSELPASALDDLSEMRRADVSRQA